MGTTVIMFGSILRALSFLFCVSTYFLLDLLERGTVSPLSLYTMKEFSASRCFVLPAEKLRHVRANTKIELPGCRLLLLFL